MKLRLTLFSIGLALGGAWLLWPPPPVAGGGNVPADTLAHATFAGGCFWCMEPPFDAVPGVVSTTSGYAGGHVKDPSYEQVSSGSTGHAESVQVAYDPSQVTYAKLLDVFWHNIDPADAGGQFCDRGNQYRSVIFYANQEQKREADESKRRLQASGRFSGEVATQIVPLAAFYPAEDYHQDFYRKNPARYKMYRFGCGRDRRLEAIWGHSEH